MFIKKQNSYKYFAMNFYTLTLFDEYKDDFLEYAKTVRIDD